MASCATLFGIFPLPVEKAAAAQVAPRCSGPFSVSNEQYYSRMAARWVYDDDFKRRDAGNDNGNALAKDRLVVHQFHGGRGVGRIDAKRGF